MRLAHVTVITALLTAAAPAAAQTPPTSARVGVHAFRADRFADRERLISVGGDLNLGFRFW